MEIQTTLDKGRTRKDARQAPSGILSGARPRTELRYRSGARTYLWITDRGRPPVIKH